MTRLPEAPPLRLVAKVDELNVKALERWSVKGANSVKSAAEVPRQQGSRKSQRTGILVELFQIDNGSEDGLVCQKWHTAGSR